MLSSQAACRAAAAYCKEKGKNISKLAMQYSLSNKDISTILVGMNSVKQVSVSPFSTLNVLFGFIYCSYVSSLISICLAIKKC